MALLLRGFKLKVMVKRILNKYSYSPDLQEEAVETVLAQAGPLRKVDRLGNLRHRR